MRVIPIPFQQRNVILNEAKDLVMRRSFASLRMTAQMIENWIKYGKYVEHKHWRAFQAAIGWKRAPIKEFPGQPH